MKHILAVILLLQPLSAAAEECVILLHGLVRNSGSMGEMEESLREAGFVVANIDYPSRDTTIDQLAGIAVTEGLEQCQSKSATPVNFVTHSLGGILVRYYLSNHEVADLGRVVMLGPPNHGSEAVDHLRDVPGFEFVNGPAGLQLGTEGDAFVKQMGGVDFELGVIAGTRSINPVTSPILPGPDDGTVSVASTRIDGMCAFLAIPTTHTFMMNNNTVIRETIAFLQTGEFESGEAESHECNRSSAARG